MLRALSRRATIQEFSLDTVAMVTIGFVSTFSEPQNIEQGISNVEVTPS